MWVDCHLCEFEGHADNSVIPEAAFNMFMTEINHQVEKFVRDKDTPRKYVIVCEEMLQWYWQVPELHPNQADLNLWLDSLDYPVFVKG